MKKAGTVYLIHFKQPYIARTGKQQHQVSHYLGWTIDLPSRLLEHRGGYGARLLEVANEAGIEWSVVQTWSGGRDLERRLKNRKNARCLCPVCREARRIARIQSKAQLQLSLS
jgi:predicted GIY-YIG superfamily endonuclease